MEKVFSVKNPISYLICCGAKDIENRSWKTDYRGKILIHSSGQTWFYIPEGVCCPRVEIELNEISKKIASGEKLNPEEISSDAKKIISMIGKRKGNLYLHQAIIGEVELVDIVKDSQSDWALPAQYHWILRNPVLYETPIVGVKGKLNLWNYEKEAI